jgi:hypothetical protein
LNNSSKKKVKSKTKAMPQQVDTVTKTFKRLLSDDDLYRRAGTWSFYGPIFIGEIQMDVYSSDEKLFTVRLFLNGEKIDKRNNWYMVSKFSWASKLLSENTFKAEEIKIVIYDLYNK